MAPRCTALYPVHDGLKQGAENSRRDGVPGKLTHLDQSSTHLRIKCRDLQALTKQIPVNVRKLLQILIEALLAMVYRRVEYLEKLTEPGPYIAPIFPRSLF